MDFELFVAGASHLCNVHGWGSTTPAIKYVFFLSVFDFEEADVCIMMFIFGVLVTHTEYSNFYLSTL